MLGQISGKKRLWPVLLLVMLLGCDRAPPAPAAVVVAPTVVQPADAPASLPPTMVESEPFGPPMPQLALVIDDMGASSSQLARVLALPQPVTLAFLPLPSSRALADLARERGHEVLLHMPMQPKGEQVAGPLAIRPALSAAENGQRLEQALQRVGPVAGVNNHMGSLATADAATMDALMPVLAARGLFFLDSRTSGASVAAAAAQRAGVPSLRRDIFLDDDPSAGAIAQQWRNAMRLLRQGGQVVVIAHPHATTLNFLAATLASNDGFYRIVPLAAMLAETAGGTQ